MYSAEERAIQAFATISALLSVFGCSLALLPFLNNRKGLKLKSKQLLVLSFIDLLTSVFYAIGYAGSENDGFCQFQAFMIQFGALSNVLWISLIAFQLHLWVIKKKNEKRVAKKLKKNAQLTLAFTFILSIILVSSGLLGPTSTWCWIEEGKDWAKFIFFYFFVLLSWTYNIWVLVKTNQACTKKDDVNVSTELVIRDKMREHLVVFILAWCFGLLNFIVEASSNEPVFATGLLQAIFVPLQGFINAVIYGGIFAEDSYLRSCFASAVESPEDKKIVKRLSGESDKKHRFESIKHVSYTPRRMSIFASTFNLGEAPMSAIGDISEWLRDGHDIYAIGFQECMCLDELRTAMHSHLGEERYIMYKVEIGSDNTRLGFHGFIALTVFVRKEDVDKGYVRMTESAAGDVANGANLVVTTAANKGAVGIPLKVYDTSVGFVTTHLPSDSKGKSKLPKRNGNAKSMLKDVVLAADDLGVDVQHTLDHLILMGDLNYRTKTPPTANSEGTIIGEGASALLGIAEASLLDMKGMNYNPKWFERKYALLHGKDSPLYPDSEELLLIESSEASSLKSWDSVLKYDELVEMMQIGEVFYGFREMMPRFPPTYKRKLHDSGDCGDYSRYEDLVKGYSHTGEDKEEVNEEALGRETIDASDFSVALDVRNSLSMDEGPGRLRVSSNAERPVSTDLSPLFKEKNKRRSSLFNFGKSSTSSQDMGMEKSTSAVPKKNKRRSSILNSFKSGAQLDAEEQERIKSKLRPPSYTDRILVHSICEEKLSIDAYGFCDSIRCSDHRPVSSSMSLTVNTEVVPEKHADCEVDEKSKVTPHAILLNVKMKNIDASFKRTGETVNPIMSPSGDGANSSAGKAASTQPSLESFAEEDEEEEDNEEADGFDLSDSSQTTLSSLFNGSVSDVPTKSDKGRRKGRSSRLSVTVVASSGIQPFEVAEDIQPAEIIIICPLPTKDPLIEYRKMYDLMNALGGHKAIDIGGLKVSRKVKEQLLQHQNVFPWKDAIQGHVEICSCGDVSVGVEALVKLIDNKGEDMGEALVNLSDIIRSEAFEKPFGVEVPISCGGQFRGKLQADFVLERLAEKKMSTLEKV